MIGSEYKRFFILILSVNIQIGFGQSLTCKDLKDGTFHCYPKNTADHYLYSRSGSYQKEFNSANGDTSLWKLNWINDCTYSLKYISGNEKMTSEVLDFLQVHKLVNKIESITNEYYLYKTYVDKAAGNFIAADTMWLHEKSNAANNTLFEQISNTTLLKKIRFADTSSYALLYVYRPGKFFGSAGEYLLYFDDNVMCVSKNHSAYLFKIYQEGTFKVSAKMPLQKENIEKIEIKFGQKYYLKAGLKFTGTTTSGWRPDILPIDPEKGSEEFLEAE